MTDTSDARSTDVAAHASQQSRLRRLMRHLPLSFFELAADQVVPSGAKRTRPPVY